MSQQKILNFLLIEDNRNAARLVEKMLLQGSSFLYCSVVPGWRVQWVN